MVFKGSYGHVEAKISYFFFGHMQVAPAELEAILLSHSSVEDAAVVP